MRAPQGLRQNGCGERNRRARSDSIPSEGVQLDALIGEYERGLLLKALEQSGGVKKRAAALLGVTFRSFRYRLEKLGLEDVD